MLSQNVNILLKKLNNMVLLCTILETEKLKRPMQHCVRLIWLIKYFYFFPGKDLSFLFRFVSHLFLYIAFLISLCCFLSTTVVRCICLY